MRILLGVAVAALALAGCSSGPSPAPPSDEPALQYEDPTIQVEVPSLPIDPPLEGERTLDAVPEWRLGEWWTYTMTDDFVGQSVDFTRVVAGSEHDNYLVGFPSEAFSNNILILHAPGFGDIKRSDLSFEAHDVLYQPIRFPVRVGDAWDTAWEGQPGRAEVTKVEGQAATVHIQGGGFDITGVYDAELGEFSSWDAANYGSYNVTGHGYHYEGIVRVPHDHDLVFFHGRFGGIADVSDPLVPPTPAIPVEEVDVEDEYDRVSFTIILGNILGQPMPVSPGYFSERMTAPDGTVHELALLPNEGDLKIEFYGHDQPGGTWTLEHTAAGPGVAFVEGIGYHSIDIDLPSGCVIASANAMHHGTLCEA